MSIIDKIDELRTMPCYLVDALPTQVDGVPFSQYALFEECSLQTSKRLQLFERFADIILKLGGYYAFKVSFQEDYMDSPEPTLLRAQILRCASEKTYMNIIIEDENAMMIVNGHDLYFSVYNPKEKLQALLAELATAQGLFFSKARGEDIHDVIANELLENWSVAAFVWLVNRGREVEFYYRDTKCFVSKSGSTSAVSLWIGEEEQGFESVEMLWSRADVEGHALQSIWYEVKLETLF